MGYSEDQRQVQSKFFGNKGRGLYNKKFYD